MRVVNKIAKTATDNERPRKPVRIATIQADMLNQSPTLRAEVEKDILKEKEAEPATEEELTAAATKIQANFRGKAARNSPRGNRRESRESDRKRMSGHMAPDLGERAEGGAGVVKTSKTSPEPQGPTEAERMAAE